MFEVNFRQNNKNSIFTPNFATFYFEIALKWSNREFLKDSNWNMRETPSAMHMHDMVTIDTTVLEIVGVGGIKAPPPRIVNFLKHPRSDKVKLNCKTFTFPPFLVIFHVTMICHKGIVNYYTS